MLKIIFYKFYRFCRFYGIPFGKTHLFFFSLSVAEAFLEEYGKILSEHRDIPEILDWAQVMLIDFNLSSHWKI